MWICLTQSIDYQLFNTNYLKKNFSKKEQYQKTAYVQRF